ncbi:lipopolysaccharide biosynthesis protein [Pseudomonas knackmussii]|nr:hypothetical protein [Pseudomonas knackmussii]
MASKFLLVFFLARLLSPAELGIFGLLSATIGYSLYLLGFDFYTYTTREMLKLAPHERGQLLKNQSAIFLLLYLIVLPLLSIIFFQGLIPWKYMTWFFLLVLLEHLTQEVGRLLITISQPLTASIVLFLRQGIWPFFAVALMLAFPVCRTLDWVLGGWSIGGFCALLLGLYKLYKMELGSWRANIDWRWIIRGLKISSSLLVATLAIRGVFTLDRYWLQALAGVEALGAYVLFIGIGNALMSFLDAGIFSFIYPGMISAWQKRDMELFRLELIRLAKQTLIVSGSFFVVAFLAISPMLHWLGKDVFRTYQDMFPWILSATTLYGLGMIPHYALYAMGRDKPIIFSHLLSLGVFVIGTWALSGKFSALAVPISLVATFLFILAFKSIALVSLRPELFRPAPSTPIKA